MIDLITNGSAHQTQAMHALRDGAGGSVINVTRIGRSNNKRCVIWGTRNLPAARREYDQVFVLERGYFNDRHTFYSLGMNGLNGRAFFNNRQSPIDRWNKYGKPMAPWKTDGDYYLVIGQVAGDMSLQPVNGDLTKWYKAMADEVVRYADRPVMFRPHPLSRSNGTPLIPLDEHLAHAKGVITFNSNTGVDAVLAGVPVMAVDIGSMVYEIAAQTIDELMNYDYPDRDQWACNLAYAQWSEDELRDGTAWKHITEQL